MDDSEVYYNNKNLRPERTKQEKEEIEKWKNEYSNSFKEEYAYEPSKEHLESVIEEKFPRNYNLSLDYAMTETDSSDKTRLAGQLSTDFSVSDEFLENEVKRSLAFLTDLQLEIIWLNKVEEFSQTEIAKMLDMSIPNVNKHIKKAEKRIEDNKKDFGWG